MCKKRKHLLLILLAVSLLLTCAATASAQQDILTPEQTQPKEPVWQPNAYTVTRGTLSMENSVQGELCYPLAQQVCVEYSGAVLEEYLADKKDMVKAGDALARIRVEIDPVTLARMELSLRQAEDSFNGEVSRRKDSIAEQKRAAALEEDALSREILELEIRRSELSLEQYLYRQEYALQSQRDELARYKTSATVTTIVSPVDGMVTEKTNLRIGDPLQNGQVLFIISDTSEPLLLLNKVPYAYFGSTVSAKFSTRDSDFTITGMAVGTDDLKISQNARRACYMRLDQFDPNTTFLNVWAKVPMLQCHNVLLLPKEAVLWEDGYGYYVMKLIDGTPVKTTIEVGYTDDKNAMVLWGVEEGDIVISER